MKTLKFFSVLSLALIFATANTAFSAIPENPGNRENKGNIITFNVNVHLAADLAICGTYQVRLVYADGSLVVPPQTFVPGLSSYVFSKSLWPDAIIPMYIWKTKITAVLVSVASNDLGCPVDLVTRPDSKLVLWTAGQVITFDLFPNQILNKKESARQKIKE